MTHLDMARSGLGSEKENLKSGFVGKYLGIRPIDLDLDITNQCNLRCVMCPFSHPSYHTRKVRHISVEHFQRLADQLFHVLHNLNLAYGTEPLLHPKITEIIKISTRYKIPWVTMNTNGILVSEDIARCMVDSGFKCVCFSVDAAEQESYERIRKGGDFQRLVKNIQRLRDIKESAKATYPEIHLSFVIMRSNIEELPAFVDLAHELGAQAVDVTHMVSYKILDNDKQSVEGIKPLCNEMLTEARRRADHLGITLMAPNNFAISEEVNEGGGKKKGATEDRARQLFTLNVDKNWKEQYFCPFPWHFMAIDHNGKVYPCGWWYDKEEMGNINEQDILTIWRGSRYRALREDLKAHKPGALCLACPAAGMGSMEGDSAFSER